MCSRDPGTGATSGRYVIVNFHGIGTPPDDIPDDELPYWISVERFTRVIDRVAELQSQGQDIRVTVR